MSGYAKTKIQMELAITHIWLGYFSRISFYILCIVHSTNIQYISYCVLSLFQDPWKCCFFTFSDKINLNISYTCNTYGFLCQWMKYEAHNGGNKVFCQLGSCRSWASVAMAVTGSRVKSESSSLLFSQRHESKSQLARPSSGAARVGLQFGAAA